MMYLGFTVPLQNSCPPGTSEYWEYEELGDNIFAGVISKDEVILDQDRC